MRSVAVLIVFLAVAAINAETSSSDRDGAFSNPSVDAVISNYIENLRGVPKKSVDTITAALRKVQSLLDSLAELIGTEPTHRIIEARNRGESITDLLSAHDEETRTTIENIVDEVQTIFDGLDDLMPKGSCKCSSRRRSDSE